MRKLFLAASLSFLLSPSLMADMLNVEGQWIREAPPGMQMMAGYATLKNPTDKAINVTAAESAAFGDIEMHTTKVIDGVAKMIEQDTLVVPAQGELELAPGGYHLMLMMPKERYTEGKTIDITLTLDNGDTQKVSFKVKKAGKMAGHSHHHSHKH